MFHNDRLQAGQGSIWAIGGLTLMSLMALIMTGWTLVDLGREQEIVTQLIQHLPASDLPEAHELAGDLRLQWRLSILLCLNIVGLGVAVTLLVRAYVNSERSLRDVRVLATDVLASVEQGIITTDREGTILSINPQGRKLLRPFDVGTEVALGDLPPDHETLNSIYRKVIDEQENVQDQDYTAHHNGHIRHLRAGCSLLQTRNQKSVGTVIHLRDVTEKNLMEQRLRQMERYMGLGSLAAGLQHEIKNPLSALTLHVQLLNEALDEESQPPEVQEMLNVLKSETRRISGVLEGFRDFAAVAALNKSEVEVSELIEGLVRLIQPQARQHNVRIETELPRDTSTRLLVDSVRIEQVLLNLVVNAIAAMPEGGTLTVRLIPTADSLDIEIADTGTGIPDDLHDKIFDPYFTTRATGTGMGLALSEKIVCQHNGTIDFQSSLDGTTFRISLPRNAVS